MGADFYIYTYLEIEHHTGIAYYDFPVKRGYFSVMNDSYYNSDYEEETPLKEEYNREYNRIYNEIILLDLIPFPPIVIYKNGSFTSHHFEDKYKTLLEEKFKKYQLSNQRYEEDPNNDSEDEDNIRHENIGIPPESFLSVIKITRKEERIRPSY